MKRVTPAQLEKQIEALRKELSSADMHFEIFSGLQKSWSDYKREISCSPVFWNHTVQAHINMVVLQLCRVYDKHPAAMHLPKFLESIERNLDLFDEGSFRERNKNDPNVESLAAYPRKPDSTTLKMDIEFCSRTNPVVHRLVTWRDNLIAHLNYGEAVAGKEPFHKRFPLSFPEIEQLIDRGFDIVNSYAGKFGKAFSCRIKSTNYPVNDYQFVLESLTAHREKLYG